MKNKKGILKAAIYCRVGNPEQQSIEKQKSKLEIFCENKGYKLFKSYLDSGYSANDKSRAAYNKLLKDLLQHKFDMIITDSLDRISRSCVGLEEFLNLTKENKCNLITLKEQFDLSLPSGKLCDRMISFLANIEKGGKNNG